MSELEIAKKSSHTGPLGLFVRVTLVVVFAYLILMSYILFDAAGPVFISVLFIVALFVPQLYRAIRTRQRQRGGRGSELELTEKSPQEG